MSNTTLSPNMSLVVPTVSTDPGPDWSNNLNASLSILDQHNHSPGSGVQVTPAGLNINSDLAMNNHSLTNMKAAIFTPQLSFSTIEALYVSGVDLFYNDGNSNSVRITQGGAVSGATGTITGLPSGTASASYQSVSGTFQFQSATNTPANLSGASVLIAQQTTSPNFITLQSPNSLAAAYSITFPTATPGTTSFLTMGTTGILAPSVSTVAGIVASNIANATITTTQISATAGILGTQLANGTVTPTQLQLATPTISSTSISFSTTATTPTTVTNLNVSITSTGGKRIRVTIIPETDNSVYATMSCVCAGTTGQAMLNGYRLNFIETNSSRQFGFIEAVNYTRIASSADTVQHFFNPCLVAVDSATTGGVATYNYAVQIQGYAPTGAGTTTVQLINVLIMAEEIL